VFDKTLVRALLAAALLVAAAQMVARQAVAQVGSPTGDSNLVTWDGLHYDFLAAGEFTAFSDNNGFVVQVRQMPIDAYGNINWADPVQTTAVATMVGTHRVDFYAQQTPPLYIDGAPASVSGTGLCLGGGLITQSNGIYTITSTTGERLTLSDASGPSVSWLVSTSKPQAGPGFTGLLGNLDGNPNNDLVSSLGVVQPWSLWTGCQGVVNYNDPPSSYPLSWLSLNGIPSDGSASTPGNFADSWRVPQQASLFDYFGPQGYQYFSFLGANYETELLSDPTILQGTGGPGYTDPYVGSEPSNTFTTPEPATLTLFGSALLGLGAVYLRRRGAKA
jgi:hypothetical protein